MPSVTKRVPDRGSLDWIAGRRPGAVHLKKRQIVRGDPRTPINRADESGLRRLA